MDASKTGAAADPEYERMGWSPRARAPVPGDLSREGAGNVRPFRPSACHEPATRPLFGQSQIAMDTDNGKSPLDPCGRPTPVVAAPPAADPLIVPDCPTDGHPDQIRQDWPLE